MRQKRFKDEQIVRILKEAEGGANVADIARKHGISEQTFYRWRRRYAGMEVGEAARLKSLEQENSRLKKLLAERDLEVEVLKEVASKNW
jgi:putative transposase